MSYTYTTNQIQLNVPGKVLPVTVSQVDGVEYWPFPNSGTDPWYSGAGTPRYFRWRITFTVTEVNHGSNLTRDDFKFNGLDIRVNDWIAGASDPKCLKIVSIESKSRTSVTCIVEDWLRYNTFKASTGNGIFNTGSAVVFTLNENGLPMLDPLPTTVGLDFFPQVFSRFQYLNPQINFVLEEENHGFNKGDTIAVTPNGFARANAATAGKIVGVVTESGPGPNYFMILPNNRIIDFDPGIPGIKGDYIYVDVDGTLSNVSTNTNKIVFINVTGPTPTVITGNQEDATVPNGTEMVLNGTTITFTGSGGTANITEMSAIINAETANTFVSAAGSISPTIITSTSAGTAYGLVGGYVPFSANINGVTVNFTTNGSQYPSISTPEDMAIDINNASITNLTASATPTVLTLTESSGGSITITNVSPDVNLNNFVGASNISGLPASTSASTTEILSLTRSDGGEILIYENSDIFQTNTGVFSGQNGSLPLALNVEQGIRTSKGTVVVADIAARDSLYAQVGDQAHVLDAGFGEWALYLYDGSSWTLIATQDSSNVDARTITTSFTGPFGGNVDIQNIGYVSPGRKITTVSVDVNTELAGGLSAPFIEVGTAANAALFMDQTDSDLSIIDEYILLPEYIHPAGSGSELLLQAKLSHFNATQGTVTIKITYL